MLIFSLQDSLHKKRKITLEQARARYDVMMTELNLSAFSFTINVHTHSPVQPPAHPHAHFSLHSRANLLVHLLLHLPPRRVGCLLLFHRQSHAQSTYLNVCTSLTCFDAAINIARPIYHFTRKQTHLYTVHTQSFTQQPNKCQTMRWYDALPCFSSATTAAAAADDDNDDDIDGSEKQTHNNDALQKDLTKHQDIHDKQQLTALVSLWFAFKTFIFKYFCNKREYRKMEQQAQNTKHTKPTASSSRPFNFRF